MEGKRIGLMMSLLQMAIGVSDGRKGGGASGNRQEE